MNAFQNIAAIAFVAGAALLIPAVPTQAQAQRVTPSGPSGPIDPHAGPPECCVPAMRTVVTDATWLVQKPAPGSTPQPASPLNGTPVAWHAAFTGSQWIGPDPNAGTDASEPSGNYIYTYHFCLCARPPRITTMPAAMSLSILGDNDYTVSLNGHTPQWIRNPTPTSLTYTQQFDIMSAPANWFQPGDNVLKITVNNQSLYTGLDVSGWISGYFRRLAPGERCSHGRID